MNEHPEHHRLDTSVAGGGVVRTSAIVGETVDCGPIPTRADTARTSPDADTSDGVRVEYRATVPRYLMGAALAEALHAINHATSTDTTRTPPDTDTPDSVRTTRRTETSAAINRAFDIPVHPDPPDPATRPA